MGDEKEIIIKVQRGELSFEIIYNNYFVSVFKYVFNRIGDKELTQDIVADVFVKVYQNMNKYQDRGYSFISWVYRIAHNEIMNYYRRSKKSYFIGITEVAISSIEEEFEFDMNEDETSKVNAIFNQLKEEDAEYLRMRFFEGLSFKEIADFFKTKESAAKMKFYRLLDKIRGMKIIQDLKA